jgi:hypothetical protein
MAIQTTLEQLEEVQTAITECLKAQSIGAADKNVLRASLASLTDRETMLMSRYKSELASGTSGGMFNKVRFDDPR